MTLIEDTLGTLFISRDGGMGTKWDGKRGDEKSGYGMRMGSLSFRKGYHENRILKLDGFCA